MNITGVIGTMGQPVIGNGTGTGTVPNIDTD